jgi:peptidoglycan/LPS O-acetylase OafA/YrhL
MVNRVTRYLGKVSYSAYFWHFPVLGLLHRSGFFSFGPAVPGWLRFLAILSAAVALTVVVSSITYLLVEAPMIRVGRQLAMRVAAKHVAVASAR